ncbi:MAG TPA: Ig-like domain-containing protein, partial [Bacillota bacterium]|nr:Ig-like domain-containing protein [Bacillota bacterium]
MKPGAFIGRDCKRGNLLTWAARSLLLLWGVLATTAPAEAQTRLKLSSISPGTENVVLVTNGDFQSQGAVTSTNTHPFPTGWTRQADMFADPGTNMVPANNGVVAEAYVSGGASVGQYKRTLTLEPATDYVLSAYLWNLGDAANHVTTVIDLNDAPQEPQITLSYSDTNADQGYFVYRSFNTANTGTNITLRIFYDNPVGTGAAARYYPVGAQWDNLAITKLANFAAPQPSGSGGNQAPAVSLTSPADGTNIVFSSAPASLPLVASASDSDGSIAKVEFYTGTTKLGEMTTSPYTLLWSGFGSGSYQLTAVATDNAGASTVSTPITISVAVPPPPAALRLAQLGTNFALYWPTSITALSLQWAADLTTPDWQEVTNSPVLSSNQYTLTLGSAGTQRFFRLGATVDPSTLTGKMLLGYQGWFACPGDGSPMNKWVHWFDSQIPVATNVTVDFWPDVSELDPDELFTTGMTLADGSPAMVYAAWNQKTVVRHFKWMKDNHLDGVFLQR